MNKRKILCAIACFMILSIATACELFDGPPLRENINDPEGVLGFDAAVQYSSTLDSITLSWNYDRMAEYNHRIYYSIDDDFSSANESGSVSDANEFIIDDATLEYGVDYNIWIQAFSKEDSEDVYFTKYTTARTMNTGKVDVDFADNGVYRFAETDSSVTDIISDSKGGFYAGGGFLDNTDAYNVIYYVKNSGELESGFGTDGKWTGPMIPSSYADFNFVMRGEGTKFESFTSRNSLYIQFVPDFSSSAFSTSATYMVQVDALTDNDDSVIVCGSASSSVLKMKRLSGDLMGEENQFDINALSYTAAVDDCGMTSISLTDDNRLFGAGFITGTGITTPYLWEFNYNTLALEEAFNIPLTTWQNQGTSYLTAIDSGGRVLLAANALLAAFDADSREIVSSFGNSGYGEGILSTFIAEEILVDPDGRILLCGTQDALNGCVYRLTADGILDTSFGDGGKFVRNDYFFNDIDILTDGHIVIAARDLSNQKGVVFCLE